MAVMFSRTRAIAAATVTYLVLLAVASVVGVIFFGRVRNVIVVPIAYLLPVWPALNVYRQVRRASNTGHGRPLV